MSASPGSCPTGLANARSHLIAWLARRVCIVVSLGLQSGHVGAHCAFHPGPSDGARPRGRGLNLIASAPKMSSAYMDYGGGRKTGGGGVHS